MIDFLIFSLIFLTILSLPILLAAYCLGLIKIEWEKSIDWKNLRS